MDPLKRERGCASAPHDRSKRETVNKVRCSAFTRCNCRTWWHECENWIRQRFVSTWVYVMLSFCNFDGVMERDVSHRGFIVFVRTRYLRLPMCDRVQFFSQCARRGDAKIHWLYSLGMSLMWGAGDLNPMIRVFPKKLFPWCSSYSVSSVANLITDFLLIKPGW